MYFDGQEPNIDLSDEGLGLVERQSDEAPQEEPETVVEPVEEETEQIPEPEVPESAPEPDKVDEDKNYAELRKWATQLSMKNADLERQIKDLAQPAPEPEPQLNKDALIQKFLDNPDGTIKEIAKQIAQEQIKPISQQLEEAQRQVDMTALAGKLQTVMPELQKDYPVLSDPSAKTALINKAVELSRQLGNDKAFQKNPEDMLQLAAIKLHGLPKQVDTQTLASATEKARQDALAELSKKEAAKNGGLSVSPTNNKSNEPALSLEDQIKADILSAGGKGGYFGS